MSPASPRVCVVPLAVGDPRRLHDGRVVAHVVHHAHEAVVEDGQRLIEDLFEGRDRRAQCRTRRGPERVHFCLLFGGEGHGAAHGSAAGASGEESGGLRELGRPVGNRNLDDVQPGRRPDPFERRGQLVDAVDERMADAVRRGELGEVWVL